MRKERGAAARIKTPRGALPPPQIRSPWRTATLVASAVAALELVLLVVLAVMLLAEPVSQHVRQAAEAKVFAPVKPKPHKPGHAAGRQAEAHARRRRP